MYVPLGLNGLIASSFLGPERECIPFLFLFFQILKCPSFSSALLSIFLYLGQSKNVQLSLCILPPNINRLFSVVVVFFLLFFL